MAGIPSPGVDFGGVADQVLSSTRTVRANLVSWRDQINASGRINGGLTQQRYQELAGYRQFMITSVAAGPAKLSAALSSRSDAFVGLDMAAEWAALKTTIEAFLSWVSANWLRRVPITNEPAWQTFNLTTFQLDDLDLQLTTPQRDAIVTRLNAVIAAIPTPA